MHLKCISILFLMKWNYLFVLGFTKDYDYIDLLEIPDRQNFLWSQDLHQNDIEINGTHHLNKRQVQQNNALLQNREYGECRTPVGESGHCRHIIYCRIPELKDDVWKLVSQLCVIDKNTIGICCPDRIVSRIGPQIIENIDDDQLSGNNNRILNHSEQRGCGITTKQYPRITGGRPAEPDEWPWMAAIIRPGVPHVWCGGVLITDRHVLTAAHCIHKIAKEQLFIRLGEYNTQLINETRSRDFRIGNVAIHLDYDPLTYENDIALIRIERPTLFNTYIWPVCMPPLGENWEEREGIVTGWGTQSFGGPHSDVLMEVSLPVWKLYDCKNVIVERLSDNVICAGHPSGGQDSCQGDSGGPLLYKLPNNRWITIGIVSWGVRCGEPMRPGVYTRVDKYLHWIVENSDI